MNYISNTSHQISLHSLIVRPYPEALNEFKKGLFSPCPNPDLSNFQSLKNRISHVVVGTFLIVPVINSLAMAILQIKAKSECISKLEREAVEKQNEVDELGKKIIGLEEDKGKVEDELKKKTQALKTTLQKYEHVKKEYVKAIQFIKKISAKKNRDLSRKTVTPSESKKEKIRRNYPPLGFLDTIMVVDGKRVSPHGDSTNFIKDEDIIRVHQSSEHKAISDDKGLKKMTIDIVEGKAVIQQQAMKSCVPTCAAMLCYDYGKEIDLQSIFDTNIADTEQLEKWLSDAGLKVKTQKNGNPLNMQFLLDQYGPITISVGGDIGNHQVILDQLNDEEATIRDPYHGWMVTIKRSAFDKMVDHMTEATYILPEKEEVPSSWIPWPFSSK